MVKERTFPKGRRVCIFCGDYGSSDEHILPDWLREIFPRDQSARHIAGSVEGSAVHRIAKVTEKLRQGHVGGRTVRDVCAKCNNEWLSQLENDVKEYLQLLIVGQRVHVTPEVQRLLALWAAKTAMTAENLRVKENGIRQYERKWLMDNATAPHNWLVWMATCNGQIWPKQAMSQNRGELSSHPVPIIGEETDYLQATVWGMGQVAFVVVGSSYMSLPKLFEKFHMEGLMRIWPPLQAPRSFIFPTLHPLNDDGMDDLANILTVSGVMNSSYDALHGYRLKTPRS